MQFYCGDSLYEGEKKVGMKSGISAFFNMFFMGNRILLFSCGDI